MAADLKWHLALALPIVAAEFTDSEFFEGWSALMTNNQCAALQCSPALMRPDGLYLLEATRNALTIACVEGGVACIEAEDRRVPWEFASASTLDEWQGRDGHPEYELRLSYWITPQEFSRWLFAQGVEPSTHIAAWFEAHGVHHGQAQPVAPEAVHDWPSLVRYRCQLVSLPSHQRPAWPPEHVALVVAYIQKEEAAGRGRGAVGRAALELGVSRQALAGVLAQHAPSQVAQPFAGLLSRRVAV